MKIWGITGKSGSGKGYVSARLQAQGIPVIDTDEIVHRLYRKNDACIAELEAAFGTLRVPSGEVDRKKLAQIVFSDAQKLTVLNRIVHRYVKDEIAKICGQLEGEGSPAVLIDAPQLFEAHLEEVCDLVIAVTAPDALRIERICRRDGISEARAKERLANQLDDAFFEAHADVVIVNGGEKDEDIDSQIQPLINQLKTK